MTNDKRLDDMADDIKYIRTRVDQHITEHGKDRIAVENRLSELEVKSGLWGLVGGLISGIGIHLSKRP